MISRRSAVWLALALAALAAGAVIFEIILRLITPNEDLPELVQAEPSTYSIRLPELITSGAWDGASSLSLPLCHKDRELGVLAIGPRRDKRPYESAGADALRESAEVLAHALDLGHRT